MANLNHTSEAVLTASPTLGACVSRASQARRLDPRVSIFVLVILNFIAFAPTRPWVGVAAVALCAVVMWWCGRRTAMVRWIMVYVALYAAGVAITLFPNAITVSFATMFVLFRRLFCIGMFASNMIATTRVGEMAAALQRLHIPRGMIAAFCVALRFFPTLGKEFVSVSEAMRLRGIALTPTSIIRHPLATIENLMVPVMSRLAIVADELSNAAIVRGIDSDASRTSYYELRLSSADAVFLLLFCGLAASVVLIKVGVIP